MTDLPPEKAFEPSGALIGFVCAALRYADARGEAEEVRMLDSPFSGIDRDDARGLIVVARERERPSEAIVAQRLALPHETLLATLRFVTALAAIVRAFRAQGAGALEVVDAIALAFGLEGQTTPDEALTLRRLRALALAFDAKRSGVPEPWSAANLIARFEADVLLGARGAPAPLEPAFALGPLEPEPAWPVPHRHGHQSASSLGAFAECERKWYYRYACGAVQDRGSSASAYGSAFHWALEQFHEEFPRADTAAAGALESKLDSYITVAFERYRLGFETNVEYELQKRRARRTARRYLSWFLERSRAHPFTVVGRETPADLEIGGYQFVGYIDRLDRSDATGDVTVVDYKTGNIAESASEYRRRIADFVDFQLPFYYWARTEQGDRVSRLALVPLKESQIDVRPIELEVVPIPVASTRDDAQTGTIGIDELERARARMVELARVLADEDVLHFAATDDPDACSYCAYVNACRSRPSRREDRFGR